MLGEAALAPRRQALSCHCLSCVDWVTKNAGVLLENRNLQKTTKTTTTKKLNQAKRLKKKMTPVWSSGCVGAVGFLGAHVSFSQWL